MIKVCVTLNESQGQYTRHIMHSHAWGRHRSTFVDDGFDSFRGIACEEHTHTHTDSGSVVYVKVVKVAYDYENKKWTD